MAGFKSGYINLDSPREVFYPGQVILGSVVFELDQPMTLSVLYVTFLGEATVDWKEVESMVVHGHKQHKEVHYVGREEYFKVTQPLAGGNVAVNLPPGKHTYQFSYQIPPGVPSTFRGKRGHRIAYSIKAILELRQNQNVMKEQLEKIFEVVAPFDLNQGSPKLKDPIDFEFEEVYSCGCFCSSDPVTIRVRLPVSGYCPGQHIPVQVQVNNDSSVEINKMIFQILTREKYRTQRPPAEFVPPEELLTTVKTGAIMTKTKRNFEVHVKVPEIIAPNLENCGIIDVGYFFRVIIKLSGCNNDLQDESEICLGLFPLNETLDGEYVHPLSQNLPIGPIPDIPVTNSQTENRQHMTNQQSGYPGGPQTQGYPGQNAMPQFPSSGYPGQQAPPPYPTDQQGSYFVQVRQQQFSSSDPSQNFNIGFTMIGSPGQPPVMNSFPTPPYPRSDLRIHLPPPSISVTTPTAPPPSS